VGVAVGNCNLLIHAAVLADEEALGVGTVLGAAVADPAVTVARAGLTGTDEEKATVAQGIPEELVASVDGLEETGKVA
jgi:hypothetical protein